MLTLQSVSKRYRPGRPVLVDVDFATAPGMVQAVTGGNGSGKSTLLRVLAGVSRPTSGTRTGDPGVIGYVPDRFPTNTRLSAEAYLAHMGRIKGLSTARSAERATELLTRLDLVGGPKTPIRELSKGNAQKVALAQALLMPPRLLILDEPWSGLDASAHGVLAQIIVDTARAGGAVVFTDHREAVTGGLATEVYRIEAGRLSRQALPARVHDTASEVLLRATRPQATDLRGLAGMRSLEATGDLVRVRVDRDRCDALLLTALQGGWTVDGVRHNDAAVPPNLLGGVAAGANGLGGVSGVSGGVGGVGSGNGVGSVGGPANPIGGQR